MDEIIKLLNDGKIEEALRLLKSTSQVTQTEIDNLRKEYIDNDRELRQRQVGNIQKDYMVGKDENQKRVYPVKYPISFQKKIVRTATAFEVGEAPSLIANDDTDLSQEIYRLWRVNRIDSKLIEMISLKKSELQCAIVFYIQTLDEKKKWYNVFSRKNDASKEIKSRLLKNEDGIMYPYFDGNGDLKAFTWEFETKEGSKDIRNVSIYTDEKVFEYSTNNEAGDLSLVSDKSHGFGKIPVVYINQDKSEWDDVKEMIDRLELSVAKLGDSNDYTGHPILKLYGEVKGMPEKDASGKALLLEQKKMRDGTILTSDADFLTYSNAPDSVKLELETLERLIYTITNTPDLSFDSVKGLGNISGVALRLIFLDAIIKAKINEGPNRTMIERIINVMIAGIVTTTQTKLKDTAKETYFDVKFNSIIPQDLEGLINMLSTAVGSKIMSQKTAVEQLNIVENTEEELDAINGVTDDNDETPAEE